MPRNYRESMILLMGELEAAMRNVQIMYDYDWNDSSDASVDAEKLVKKAKKLGKRIAKNIPDLNMIDQLIK